jgi:P27 family predicted phage terminase small subunit
MVARTPTRLKTLKGSTDVSRQPKNEPKPPLKIPKPPAHLNEIALEEYAAKSKQLFNCGLLTEVDGTALAAYCEAYSMWVEACMVRNELAEKWMTETTTNGNDIQRPIVGIINQSRMAMLKFLSEFGMMPASRSRVSVSKRDGEKNPFAKFK